MAKVYYSIELKNGYSLGCVLDLPRCTVGSDYRTLLLDECSYHTTSSILNMLLDKPTHVDTTGEKLIKGEFVVCVYKAFFVPE